MAVLASQCGYVSLGAPGDIDPSFNGDVTNYPVINSLAVQPDGKILAGGNFTFADNSPIYRVARFNPDGSLDKSFNPGYVDGDVSCVLLETNGNVLIGGGFEHVGGAIRYSIAELYASGTLDAGFNPSNSLNGAVLSIALQPAGTVVIGGDFSKGIARLNSDGSVDTNFNVGSGANGAVTCVASEPDGKVLIGGAFSSVNGVERHFIARLNTNGTLDAGFDPGIPLGIPRDSVTSILLQSNGDVIAGGSFAVTVNGTNLNNIIELDPNGSINVDFNPGSGGPNGTVYAIAPEANGQLIVSGYFGMVGKVLQGNIARLDADGDVDQSFKSMTAWWGTIEERPVAITSQADNKLLIGGSFDTVDGAPHNGIARLFGDYPPTFTSIKSDMGGGVAVSGVAATNAYLEIDTSSNLMDWAQMSVFTNAGGVFTIQDYQQNGYAQRFYRAVWLP